MSKGNQATETLQKHNIGTEMRKYKAGGKGAPTSQAQAVAIGMSEARKGKRCGK